MGLISTRLENFLEEYEGKEILCFGSGSYFQIMLEDIWQRGVDISIKGVFDNNREKDATTYRFLQRDIPVFHPDKVNIQFDLKDIPILITTASHNEVLSQLKEWPTFDEMSVYSYYDLKKESTSVYTKLDRSQSQSLIPKIIHYCWFGGGSIPLHLQKCINSWKKHCPDYEIKEWNETNYDVSKNFFLRTAFQRKKWSFVSDYARLDIVYHYGGIYLDTDVQLLKSMDTLTFNPAFFCTEVSGGINGGSGFGAVKNNVLVKELMNVYEHIEEETPYLFNTCMGKEIGVFHRNGYRNNGKYQQINNAAIYPYQIMAPKLKEEGGIYQTNATIGMHHFDGSWCENILK